VKFKFFYKTASFTCCKGRLQHVRGPGRGLCIPALEFEIPVKEELVLWRQGRTK